MEGTLHNFIPLIRFYQISSEDFHNKIYPLKELLPKDLVNNLLIFYLVLNDPKSMVQLLLIFDILHYLLIGLIRKMMILIIQKIFLIILICFIVLIGVVIQMQHFMKNQIIKELILLLQRLRIQTK